MQTPRMSSESETTRRITMECIYIFFIVNLLLSRRCFEWMNEWCLVWSVRRRVASSIFTPFGSESDFGKMYGDGCRNSGDSTSCKKEIGLAHTGAARLEILHMGTLIVCWDVFVASRRVWLRHHRRLQHRCVRNIFAFSAISFAPFNPFRSNLHDSMFGCFRLFHMSHSRTIRNSNIDWLAFNSTHVLNHWIDAIIFFLSFSLKLPLS